MALHNILVKVKWVNDSPLFPRPIALAESELWTPDYWAIGNVVADGISTGWCIYQMNGLSDVAVDAMKMDDNYRDVVAAENN